MGGNWVLFKEVAEEIIKEEEALYDLTNKRESFAVEENSVNYIYNDRLCSAGTISNYFWQDIWAAKKVLSQKTDIHYDIGSRVDGFISHLILLNQKIYLIDVRPLDVKLPGVDFIQADATDLSIIEDGSISSLSALCSLEHIGLGRYGDKIDGEGWFKCFDAIQRKIKSEGNIYISVPIGREHVEFNAHRVFNPITIIRAFDRCELVELSAAHDDYIEENINLAKYSEKPSRGSDVFGLFHFRRK